MTKSGDQVTSWESKTNVNGKTYTVTANDSDHVTFTATNPRVKNQPSINFNGAGQLTATDFTEISGKESFTRIVVVNTENGHSAGAAYSDSASGYESYVNTNYIYSKTRDNSAYFRITKSNFDYIDTSNPFISTTRFDSAEETNIERMNYSYNGTKITSDQRYHTGTFSAPTTSSNLYIGSNKGSNFWKGDIMEVIIFPRKLHDMELTLVEDALKTKYGIGFTCGAPATTPDGYVLDSCDTSEGNIATTSCSVSCDEDNGWRREGEVVASCITNNGEFSFSGCHDYSTLSKALARNVLHLEAGTGVTVNEADSLVSSWSSKVDRDGNTHAMAGLRANGPSLTTVNGEEFLHFNGADNTEVLTNDTFKALQGKTRYTRVEVFKPENANGLLLHDPSTGHGSQISANSYKLRSSSSGSGNAVAAVGYDTVDEIQIAVTEVDTTQSSNSDKVKLRLNKESQSLTFTAAMNTPAEGVSAGLTIGNWSTNSYNYKGKLAEVIFFENVLPEDVRLELETTLMNKYGLIKKCTLPGDTTGYNTTACDTSGGGITIDNCSVTCATGYSAHSLFAAQAQCASNGSNFTLSGCYADATPPTNDQVAENID